MPRYPKPPPTVLCVESLSTGLPVDMDGPQTNDFTGEPITRVWPDAAPRVMRSAQDILDELNREKHRQNQLLLQAAGIVAKPETIRQASKAAPQRPHTITLKRNDWRRV